jgi:hypothetical protein
MLKSFSQGLLLLGALTIAGSAAAQAAPGKEGSSHVSADVAVMMALEHAQVAETNGNRFWAKGAAVDAGISVWKGIGFAFDLSFEHASNIENGVNLSKVAFMAGPRYSFDISRPGGPFHSDRPVRAFVQTLYGPTHATDSLFPDTIPLSTTAEALSVAVGGGVDVPVKRGLGIRALDVAWIHSNYSNAAANVQNDLRIGFGVSYRR